MCDRETIVNSQDARIGDETSTMRHVICKVLHVCLEDMATQDRQIFKSTADSAPLGFKWEKVGSKP